MPEFAKRVGRGDLAARLIPKGENEFGTLGSAQPDDRGAAQLEHVAGKQRAAELTLRSGAQDEVLVRRGPKRRRSA